MLVLVDGVKTEPLSEHCHHLVVGLVAERARKVARAKAWSAGQRRGQAAGREGRKSTAQLALFVTGREEEGGGGERRRLII